MNCSACGKNKHNLSYRKSKLLGTPLFLCSACIEAKHEPRFIIIMHGRANGIDTVSEYLKGHRYSGDEILATDFV